MKGRNWFWGAFFVVAAVLLVASQLGSFVQIGFWSVIATIALVALFAKSIAKRNFLGILLSGALLYIIYQGPLHLLYISPWLLLLAAVLASIGLSMLFKKKPPARPPVYGGVQVMSQTYENDDGNNPQAKVSFGAATKYLRAGSLESGQFEVSFGELEVFFDQVALNPGGAQIFVNCSFGSIKLFVPRYWQVIDRTQSTIGGVNNTNSFPPSEQPTPTIVLTGNVTLGEVEVVYV